MPAILSWTRSEIAPGIIAAIGLGLIYAASAKPVELILDGEPTTLRTHARVVEDVLHDAGINLGPNDILNPERAAQLDWSSGGRPVIQVISARAISLNGGLRRSIAFSPQITAANLFAREGYLLYPGDRLTVDGLPDNPAAVMFATELNRAVEIRVSEWGVQHSIFSAAPSLGEALVEAGYVLHEGDLLSLDPNLPLSEPLALELRPARPITVRGHELTISTRSAADSIGGALGEAGIDLLGLDYTVPSADQPLPADGQIQLVRVREEVVLEQRPMPFDTLYQPLPNVEIDNQQVIQAGAYGVSTNRVRIRSEDGVEVGRLVEGEWVAQEANPQIIGYGTDIRIRAVETADGTLEVWRAVEMYTTSYSPSNAGIPEDHPWYGITASGKPLRKGLVAIDRSLIPFGTMMYVPGYGFAEAADTGGGVKGRWIDLGYEDDNYVPWSGYRTVYFLTPVPPPDSIVYIFP